MWLRPQLSSGTLGLVASAFFACSSNGPFLRAALAGRHLTSPSTWGFGAAMLAMLFSLHALLILPLLSRRTVRPLLAALFVVTAFATYYMQRFGVYLDPSMLRNVLNTDPSEARELFGWDMVPHLLLYAGLPLLALAAVRPAARPPIRALGWRLVLIAAIAVTLIASVLLVFQGLSGLMRNQKELRYLITPANFLYSTARVWATDAASSATARTTVAADARLDDAWASRKRPVLLVVVVGETARAANWGLSGYARQTTPQLAQRDSLVNFTDLTACGTNTEVSLPCMFSAIGRRKYDEGRIRGSESLLHVLARAGFDVTWLDNQSGCKGVCEGLRQRRFDPASSRELCSEDRCLDEILLEGLDAELADRTGNRVVVLHMLGNHGPAYYRRYPNAFRRFEPTCDTGELRSCTREQIVNAYDNALLYTDHVLDRLVDRLERQRETYDTAMIFVSDHGESLGEAGLYLHGLPYAIAPAEQTRVPMVWWLSPEFSHSFDVNPECVRRSAARAWTHDSLFHTMLGLLQVRTTTYEPALDIAGTCHP